MNSNVINVIRNKNSDKYISIIEIKEPDEQKILLGCIKPDFLTEWDNAKDYSIYDSSLSRRRNPRFNYHAPCTIEQQGVDNTPVIHSEVEDISVDGIGIKNYSYNFKKSDHVKLSFGLPDTTANCETEAIIVNINKDRMGLKFHKTNEQPGFDSQQLIKCILTQDIDCKENRRTGHRLPLMGDCRISLCHMQPIKGIVKDISTTGICLTGIPPEYQGGVEVEIIFPFIAVKENITGQIVWNNDNKAGIRFYDELDSPLDILFNVEHIRQIQLTRIVQERLLYEFPQDMIPGYFHFFDSFPVNGSGKVDEKILKESVSFLVKEKRDYIVLNKDEKVIRDIWLKTLNGSGWNFFNYKQVIDKLPAEIINKYPMLKLLRFTRKEEVEKTGKSKKEEKTYYPLTHPQKRIWYSERIYPESCIGNLFHSCRYPYSVDITLLKKAINVLVKSNRILRLRIKLINDNPVQYISEYTPFPIDHFDFTDSEGEIRFKKWTEKITTVPLTGEDSNLFYFATVIFPDKKAGFFFGIHHIIADETGIAIIIKQIKEFYDRLSRNRAIPAENFTGSEACSYLTYIQHENEYKGSEKFLEDEKFWLDKLDGYTDPAFLKKIDHITNIQAKRKEYYLPKEIDKNIKDFCKKENTSIFRLFLAVLYIYLNRITGKSDIIIGSAFHNRFNKKFKPVIGMVVSTVPFRINFFGNCISFQDILDYIKCEIRDIKKHQEYPYDILINKCKKESKNQYIFDILLNYQNMRFELPATWHFHGASNFPLAINISHRSENGNLKLEVDYHIKLFKESEIDRFYSHLFTLLTQVLKTPEQSIFKLEILTYEEKHQILHEFNNTSTDFPGDKTIHQLFEEQVKRTPDNVAVFFEGKTLTYKELNEKANQLARVLKRKGVKPNTIIAMILYRSFDMIIGILGILKAGGVYLPIDPDNPADRKSYLLKDSQASLVLTTQKLSMNLNWTGEIIKLDEYKISHEDCLNLNTIMTSRDLAYIIYTSGSTGNPKGVMIEHRSVVNILLTLENKYPISKTDAYLLKTNYTFDVSIAEIFGWFIGKGRLVILHPGYEKEPRKMLNTIYKEKITHINFVPSMFKLFLYSLEKSDRDFLKSLKYIFVAGEAITQDIVNDFNQLDTKIQLENLYGPTESTIYATGYALKNCKNKKNIPIGKPLSNIECYIVNKYNQLMPIGVPGELCLGGVGLSKGYLNRSELTKERFIANPFKRGQRMYKTGDQCCWVPDGNIEYFGRIDFQVKIRGYRIELGEIENAIRSYKGVKDVVVLAKKFDSNDIRLAAYIVEKEESIVDISLLKSFLKKRLPDYMVPFLYTKLDNIPLNQNGKINRKILKELKLDVVKEEIFTAPTCLKEKQISIIWKDILKIDKVGVHDNFLEVGGNSLKLIELSVKLNKVFHKDIPVTELFKYPTIKKQAEYILMDNKNEDKQIITYECKENNVQNEDIAIIGLAGRFPGAKNIDEYWNNLISGKETITFFSDEELLEAGIVPEIVSDPAYIKAKGILNDIEYFDADFFGYTKKDAWFMDPQVRIFHEVAYEALENAGYISDRFDGKIGIFAGASENFFWQKLLLSQGDEFSDLFPLMILNKNFLSTRIAYKLNLKGPACTVQTACSTSLVAVDMAVRSLLEDDCDIALAGGVSLFLPQKQGYHYKEGFTLSPDGHCRAFDAAAKGMVMGEGAGIVVLKRLNTAIQDKDIIWAVIKGSASNNDGSDKIGYTAPSITGQAEVIKKGIQRAGINPETITYIEAHGTGTNLGDPVEIEGLKLAFNTTKKQFCRIGSVKTNIGHLDTAAGIAGLIKTVLMLHYKKIPPSLHFIRPNPKIDFTHSPFIVNTKLLDWERKNNISLLAGVSAFGIGGTNAHVILEESPIVVAEKDNIFGENNYQLILLSARSEQSLNKMTENLHTYLITHPEFDFNAIAYTLMLCRQEFDYRRSIICRNTKEMIEMLLKKDQHDNVYTAAVMENKEILKNMEKRIVDIFKEIKNTNGPDYHQLYELGKLWCKGVSVKWNILFSHKKQQKCPLPGYSFERKSYSIDKVIELIKKNSTFIQEFDLNQDNDFIQSAYMKMINSFYIDKTRYYEDVSKKIDELCSVYIYLFFQKALKLSMQKELSKGSKINKVELRTLLKIIPTYEKMYNFFIKILEDDGIIQIINNEIEFIKSEKDILDISVTIQTINEKHSDMNGILKLLEHCTKFYFQVMTGEMPGVSVLYPAGKRDLLDTIELNLPIITIQQELNIEVVKNILHYYLEKRRNNRKIKILEIGGGRGLLTWKLLEILQNFPVEYWFTDIGKAFVLDARKKAESINLDFFHFSVLDITKSPAEQNFPANSFDIILGMNVVHVTKNIHDALKNLKELLVSNGLLCLVEATKAYRWISMTWGVVKDWWYFDDERVNSPLISCKIWAEKLKQAGFESIKIYPENANQLKDSWALILGQQGLITKNNLALQKRSYKIIQQPINKSFYNGIALKKKDVINTIDDNKNKDDSKNNNEFENMNEIEKKLLKMYKNFFMETDININDNFFNLGGDSLLAIQMIHQINNQFNLNLSYNIFFNYQTVKELCNVIEEMILHRKKTYSIASIIELKKGQTKYPPIFLIHPASGTVYFYRELCLYLAEKQAVYGIEAQGVNKHQTPLTSIKEMAEKYNFIIQQIQPKGQYYIGGSSLGGCIAYEMALQLQEQNKDIGAVFMIDVPGPKSVLCNYKNDIEILAYFLSYNNIDYQNSLEILRTLSKNERLYYYLKQKSIYKQTFFDEYNIEELKRSIHLTLLNIKAMKEYYLNLSNIYYGKVLFFSATKVSHIPINLENGWRDFFRGECIVHKVPGNHITINISPAVKVIAQHIQKYLDMD